MQFQALQLAPCHLEYRAKQHRFHIFYPEPKVDGIVLEFTPIKTFIDVDLEKLNIILKNAFENRRKKIKNSLQEYSMHFNDWDKQKDLRPENLEVEKYCFLARKS